MIRTQIQLSEDQMARLKRAAAEEGVSVAEVIRRLVEAHLTGGRERLLTEAIAASRRLRGSGLGDLSARHDDYFAESVPNE